MKTQTRSDRRSAPSVRSPDRRRRASQRRPWRSRRSTLPPLSLRWLFAWVVAFSLVGQVSCDWQGSLRSSLATPASPPRGNAADRRPLAAPHTLP
jgi:hypothetical protein